MFFFIFRFGARRRRRRGVSSKGAVWRCARSRRHSCCPRARAPTPVLPRPRRHCRSRTRFFPRIAPCFPCLFFSFAPSSTSLSFPPWRCCSEEGWLTWRGLLLRGQAPGAIGSRARVLAPQQFSRPLKQRERGGGEGDRRRIRRRKRRIREKKKKEREEKEEEEEEEEGERRRRRRRRRRRAKGGDANFVCPKVKVDVQS